jgi:hypothetical protein
MAKWCVVKHSQTTGEPSGVVGCFAKKTDAEHDMRRLNRGAGMGRFYNIHKDSVVRGWHARGDRGNWSFEGARRRRR